MIRDLPADVIDLLRMHYPILKRKQGTKFGNIQAVAYCTECVQDYLLYWGYVGRPRKCSQCGAKKMRTVKISFSDLQTYFEPSLTPSKVRYRQLTLKIS